MPPQRSLLVNASKIGTDEVFARSALIAQRPGGLLPGGVGSSTGGSGGGGGGGSGSGSQSRFKA